MKITDTIHALKHHFRLSVGEGLYADRSVYSYILFGKKICLIDTGVASSSSTLLDYIRKMNRSPEEISMVLLTHAHPDHIGGCLGIKKNSQASFAAHPVDRPWIEDVKKQHQERPILNFFELVEGPVPISRDLREGDVIPWDEGKTIRVLETPGHSLGAVSFLDEEEGALFSGDAIPAAGALPIYADPKASIRSIEKLQKVSGVKYLFSSWHDPISGDQIYKVMEDGLRYIKRIDEIVSDLERELPPSAPLEELSLLALERLGIRAKKVSAIVMASFQAHRKR
ncbi:MAG: MBL fold metallo-hydrolase [Syntrophaceae bacterium]|nr:MBL fold metallo-hydrolase [Syntrophaceae bacterium]